MEHTMTMTNSLFSDMSVHTAKNEIYTMYNVKNSHGASRKTIQIL